jgi:hypothetical protein
MSWLYWDLGILANNQWEPESEGLAKMEGDGGKKRREAMAEITWWMRSGFGRNFPISHSFTN